MGLGTSPCGFGACGFDLQQPSGRVNRRIPDALDFDGGTKNFKLDDDGLYVGAHPVDAKTFLICRTTAGSIRSAPGLGQTVGQIPYIDQRTVQATVSDRFRSALSTVVAAGEIRIERIDVDTAVRGRIMTTIHYVNLVTGKRQSPQFTS
jgi:hypothetical protein